MKNLIELIKASHGGSGGADGQTFRNDVAGASNYTAMTDYILPSGTAIATWDPYPDTVHVYDPGQTFNPYVAFGYYGAGTGSRTPYIRLAQSAPYTEGWTNNTPNSVTLNSVAWDDNAGTATLNVTINGVYDESTNPSGVTPTFNFDFDVSGHPEYHNVQGQFPPDDGWYNVSLNPGNVPNGTGASGQTVIYPSFTYDPDPGQFNPVQNFAFDGIQVKNRAYPGWKIMFEWRAYRTSGFSDTDGTFVGDDGSGVSFYSDNNTRYDPNLPADFLGNPINPYVYVKWRKRAYYNGGVEASWNYIYTPIGWADGRPYY